jgi:hypothetical protein
MNKGLIGLLSCLVIASIPVHAAGNGGNKGMSQKQGMEHRSVEQVRGNMDQMQREERMHDREMMQEKDMQRRTDREMQHRTDDDMNRGMEKQREMKMDQEQKELGKGSEQGQETREEHRKKWWKFWE